MDDCLELESDPKLVVAARQFVRERLTSWEATDHLEQAVLVASELVTNAVLHARTAIQLKVSVDGPRVRIEVFDEPDLAKLMVDPKPDLSPRGTDFKPYPLDRHTRHAPAGAKIETGKYPTVTGLEHGARLADGDLLVETVDLFADDLGDFFGANLHVWFFLMPFGAVSN